MTAHLELSDVRGGYVHDSVLKGVSLEVHPEEIVAVLGANGAGKTSLLRAISGVLPICRGTFLLDGQALPSSPWSRVRAGVAHVPEGRHVFTAMTVEENLAVAGLGADRSGAERVYALFPKLAQRRRQAAGTLSGGEQQMVAIGRAVMCVPKVLVIDEMSAGLAPIVVDQLVDGLVQLRAEDGTAVLLVEQSPHYVADALDRLYILDHGTTVGHGTLDELGGADRLAELYLGVSQAS